LVLMAPQIHGLVLSKIDREDRSSPADDRALDSHSSQEAEDAESQLHMVKERYLSLLMDSLTGALTQEAGSCVGESEGGCSETKPFDPALHERGNDWPPYGQTMIGNMRMRNVRTAIEDTIKNGVPGEFAELGTWRGGTSIWAKALYNLNGKKDQKVHMFDLWGPISGNLYGNFGSYLSVPREQVVHNFMKYQLLDKNVLFHKGLFSDTVPSFANDNPDLKLAVLRIDANFYDSYQDALYYMYPKVPVGGYIIFDDVYADPVRCGQAWTDFKVANGLPEDLTKIDDASAYFKKTVDKPIDRTRMKPPQDTNIKM